MQNGPEITAPLRKVELDVLFNYLIRHQPFLIRPTDCVDLFPKLTGFPVTQKMGQIHFDFMCNGAQWILTHPVQYSDFSPTLYSNYDASKSWTWLSDDVTVGYVTIPKYATHTVVCMGRPHFQHSASPFLHRRMGTFRAPCIMHMELEHQSQYLRLKKPFSFIAVSVLLTLWNSQDVYCHSKSYIPGILCETWTGK